MRFYRRIFQSTYKIREVKREKSFWIKPVNSWLKNWQNRPLPIDQNTSCRSNLMCTQCIHLQVLLKNKKTYRRTGERNGIFLWAPCNLSNMQCEGLCFLVEVSFYTTYPWIFFFYPWVSCFHSNTVLLNFIIGSCMDMLLQYL